MMPCTWDNPGADRYVGSAAQAIYSFASIPEPIKHILLEKHEKRQSDDVVAIDATSIRGKTYEYENAIWDMHFGANKQCESVTRRWSPEHVETALVYCEGSYCIAWPAVCGNWFLIQRTRERFALPVGTPQPVPLLPVPSVLQPPAQPTEPKEDGPEPITPLNYTPVPWTYVPGQPTYMPIPITSPAPEPEVWFLMIGGLIFVMRRARRDA